MKSVEKAIINHVNKGELSGAACAVYRGEETLYRKAIGYANKEENKPLRENSIFRIGGMTKPITAAAVMILVERGKIKLEAPINRYLKGFRIKGVGKPAGDKLSRESTASMFTLKDVLTESSGFASGEIGRMQAANLPCGSLEERVEAMNDWYLDFAPGTASKCSCLAYDLAARAVEVAADMPFADFVKEKIFTPLGMDDTCFVLSPENAQRLVALDGKGKTDPAENCLNPEGFASGSCGLYSTLGDYSNFARMLVSRGVFNGKRVMNALSALQITRAAERGEGFTLLDANVYGMGVKVMQRKWKEQRLPKDSFAASGKYGTHFWAEPKTGVVAVFMANYAGADNASLALEFERNVQDELAAK